MKLIKIVPSEGLCWSQQGPQDPLPAQRAFRRPSNFCERATKSERKLQTAVSLLSTEVARENLYHTSTMDL